MKKSLFKKVTKIFFILLLYAILLPSKTFAKELEVDWGVPSGDPIFEVSDMLPGDSKEKEISVKNIGSATHSIGLKGVKTSETKDFSEILDVEISANSTVIYDSFSDPKKLKDFFNDSSSGDGILLGPISPNETTAYKIKVAFPSEAGNEYQKAQVIFYLEIGIILDSSRHLVINEVYYDVGKNHGNDYPEWMPCYCSNFSDYYNRYFSCCWRRKRCCCWKSKRSDEWVELYNPTSQNYYLRNWSLEDNSGQETKILSPRVIRPGEFVLISKNLVTWYFWNEPVFTKKIMLFKNIGNGLDDGGDHLYLKNPKGEIVDSVGWGSDVEVWGSDQPEAGEGNSIERLFPGFDTDSPPDWQEIDPPTPGS